MTRGRIILIQGNKQLYTTCEFNGDMHPNMHTPEMLYDFISKNGVIYQKEV